MIPEPYQPAWTPVRYPGAVLDEATGRWISDAQVAETSYTAFETTSHKVTARLVVRRVRERNPAPPGAGRAVPDLAPPPVPDRRQATPPWTLI